MNRLKNIRQRLTTSAAGLAFSTWTTLFTAQAGAEPAVPPSSAPLRTVPRVDLHRYMGDWRVIANIPYFGEKNCVDSIESYGLRSDGRIANTFTYRKKSFQAPQKQLHALAWVTNPRTNAEWRVRFFGLITLDYLVIDLDPEYRWAVVGYPNRKYGWVLARERVLPEAVYKRILQRLAGQGYDPGRFVKVPQTPAEIGYLH
jgi:apolipoprotein D and lipocalin family protein